MSCASTSLCVAGGTRVSQNDFEFSPYEIATSTDPAGDDESGRCARSIEKLNVPDCPAGIVTGAVCGMMIHCTSAVRMPVNVAVPLFLNVTVPANYSGGSGEIKGKLRFQACNDESCFPPVTREVKMWLNVE